MILIPVVWTKYTATLRGRVLKLVPCESCGTEYVYVLEREGTGVGTSVYLLNEQGAHDHAQAAADDTLRSYLENDFDPVPCPVCGYYQRYMYPKLYRTGSAWRPVALAVALLGSCLAGVGGVIWTVESLLAPTQKAIERLWVVWPLFGILVLIGYGLSAFERAKVRRFDPNVEDQQSRIAKGRSRAITRAEFEATQRST